MFDERPDIRCAFADISRAHSILIEIDMQMSRRIETSPEIGSFGLFLEFGQDVEKLSVRVVIPTAPLGNRLQRLSGGTPEFLGCLQRISSLKFDDGLVVEVGRGRSVLFCGGHN